MKKLVFVSSILLIIFAFCSPSRGSKALTKTTTVILKANFNLSAFGVESDSFPTIDAVIDFELDTSYCVSSYYDPAIKGREYKLTSEEIKKILLLLQNTDLSKLKTTYTVGNRSDQPTSTTTVLTSNGKYTIKDYGLKAEYPLQELYKLVYKF